MKKVPGALEHMQPRLARLPRRPGQHRIGRHDIIGVALGQHPVAIGRIDVTELVTHHGWRDRNELSGRNSCCRFQRHECTERKPA